MTSLSSCTDTHSSTSLIPLEDNPFALFKTWMAEAEKSEPCDPNAMSVATATPDGHPSVRILLLKGVDERGFVFYTNNHSRKGDELRQNPHAALLFYWKSLGRQVRIEGPVEPVTQQEADTYFASRSRLSRLGAVASEQSQPLASRALFEKRLAELQDQFSNDAPIPRPPHWSGHRVRPRHFEFWQERPYRLHDRAVWDCDDLTSNFPCSWKVTRLYP